MNATPDSRWSDFARQGKAEGREEGGFSIVLALGLMAFLVLLFLSLASLNRIEVAASRNFGNRILARRNALFGLEIAIGKLQKEAGPDQRVSATAGSFQDRPDHFSHWIGIWDVDHFENGPVWMVSGKAPAVGKRFPPGTSVLMVGENSAEGDGNHVEAEKVAISHALPGGFEGRGVSGHYAWWIGDEGLKATIAKSAGTRPGEAAWASRFSNAENKQFGQMMAMESNPQLAFRRKGEAVLFDPGRDGVAERLEKVRSRDQFPLISGIITPERSRERFHDLTPRAFGLLVSPRYGLKKDLSSHPDLLRSSGFSSYMDYETYMRRPERETHPDFRGNSDSLRRRYRMVPPNTAREAEIRHSVAPVLTDFFLLFTVARGTADAVIVRYRMHVELWNPYTSALLPEDLELEINGLPTVSLRTEDGQSQAVDLQKTLNNEDRPGLPLVLLLPFRDNPLWPGEDDHSWLPGRVYSWIAPNNASGGSPLSENSREAQFYNRTMHNGIWEETVEGVRYPLPLSQEFRIISPSPTRLSIQLKRVPERGGETLVHFENFQFDDFETGYYGSTRKPIQFGFRFRLFEAGDLNLTESGWAKGLWLRNNDPRDPNPTFGSLSEGAAYFPPNGFSPDSYTLVKVKQPQWLFDRVQGKTGKNYMEDVPLFELPRQPHLSLGALQHLQIVGRPPFSIGNSWGSAGRKNWNTLFDRYFFSGLSSHSADADLDQDPPFPNMRLRLYETKDGNPLNLAALRDPGSDSGRYFMIFGAFNVNSTSFSAWEAVLGGLFIDNWNYVNADENLGEQVKEEASPRVLRKTLREAFFRFSQSGQETYETGPHTGPDRLLEPPTEFYRRGVKSLREAGAEGGDSELRRLAELISGKVKRRIRGKGPFTSIGEFLSPDPLYPHPEDPGRFLSPLEAALAEVPAINAREGREVHDGSSEFLTQADILTALAPLLTVRSDTFLIRSYGDSVNPVTGEEEGRAWCEAIVQRVPTLADVEDDRQITNPSGYGRKFKMIGFKWLDPADI